MFGRNGECPSVVIACKSPSDCFETAFEACKIALEFMVPVVLLSDGYIANGSEPWKLPDLDKLSKINTKIIKSTKDEKFFPYKSSDKRVVFWFIVTPFFKQFFIVVILFSLFQNFAFSCEAKDRS